MTEAEQIEHLRAALARLKQPVAFYDATSPINPEAHARMLYARYILEGYTLKAADDKAQFETRQRYPLPRADLVGGR